MAIYREQLDGYAAMFQPPDAAERPLYDAPHLSSPLLRITRPCCYSAGMTVAITVRNVPEEVRDELAARAALSGRSLQEYLLSQFVDAASRPTVDAVVRRARERLQVTGTKLGKAAILADRDADRR